MLVDLLAYLKEFPLFCWLYREFTLEPCACWLDSTTELLTRLSLCPTILFVNKTVKCFNGVFFLKLKNTNSVDMVKCGATIWTLN